VHEQTAAVGGFSRDSWSRLVWTGAFDNHCVTPIGMTIKEAGGWHYAEIAIYKITP
jgi:hypothetical protein